MTMKSQCLCAALVVLSAGAALAGAPDKNVRSGLAWLASKQNENGSWSNENFPALTAMPLRVFLSAGLPEHEDVIKKATEFITSHVQDDGGIYKKSLIPGRGGLSTYNTAVCMAALHETGDPAYTEIVRDARKFVASSQRLGDDHHAGGFGYSRKSLLNSSDLINTSQAFEAMRVTQEVEDTRPAGEAKVDIDWEAGGAYLERVQNDSDAGANQAGGFFYKPGKSAAGTTTNDAGEVVFRSYGSMTYMGLLSLIYVNVSRDDARIRSAFDWAARHWSLDENPGLGVNRHMCLCSGGAVVERVTVQADGTLVSMSTGMTLTIDTEQRCEERYMGRILGIDAQRVLDRLHFLSSGMVSFARGMNDTPKIVALLATGAGLGLSSGSAMLGVGVAMAIGGILNARRVAETMSKKITTMNHGQGFTANLVTAFMVTVASRFGVPVSTTHVSCGSLFGLGAVSGSARWPMIRSVLLSWVLTLPIAASLAALVAFIAC